MTTGFLLYGTSSSGSSPSVLLKPNRASYNGTAGSGYSNTTLTMLNNINTGDSTTPKRGFPISNRPEYGYLGRVYDTSSKGFTIDGTVAPILHCLTHPVTDQMITNTNQAIGVQTFAAASDGMLAGISSVDFFCESDTPINVPLPTPGGVQTWAGTRIQGMYQAILSAADLNNNDSVNIYMRANPSLPGVSPRVIGPFTFFKRSDYDVKLTLDTNASSSSVDNVNSFNDPSVLLNSIANSAYWDTSSSNKNSKSAFIKIDCADKTVIDFAKYSFVDNTSKMFGTTASPITRRGQVLFNGLGICKISNSQYLAANFLCGTIDITNFKIDIANITNWDAVVTRTRYSVLRKCEIYSSQGMTELTGSWGVGSKTRRGSTNAVFPSYTPTALLACWFHDCLPVDIYVSVVIGCQIESMANDAADIVGASTSVLYPPPMTCVANTYRNITGAIIRTPNPAAYLTYTPANGTSSGSYSILGNNQNPVFINLINLIYSGSGVASYDITGSHGNYVPSAGQRKLTLKVNGSAISGGSFTFGQNGLYTFADLYNAINTLGNGWLGTTSSYVTAGGIGLATTACVFQGSISGSTLTVTNTTTGALAVGQMLFTANGTVLTTLSSQTNSTTWKLASSVTTSATNFGSTDITSVNGSVSGNILTVNSVSGGILAQNSALKGSDGSLFSIACIGTKTMSTFNGSISGTTLTITSSLSGTIAVGQSLALTGNTISTIVSQLSSNTWQIADNLSYSVRGFSTTLTGTGTGGAGTYVLTSVPNTTATTFISNYSGTTATSPYLLSKMCNAVNYSGDILNQPLANITCSGSGTTLTVTNVNGTITPGQVFTASDNTAVLPRVKSYIGLNTSNNPTYLMTSSISTNAGTVYNASLALGSFDTRTLVLSVDNVPVKAFPALVYPSSNSSSGSYFFEDYSTQNDLVPAASEFWTKVTNPTICYGLNTAINSWATTNNNGWSCSVSDSGGNSLLGTQMRMMEMVGPVTNAYLNEYFTPAVSIYAAVFLNVPLRDANNTPIPISTCIDAHVDINQSGGDNYDNVLFASNYGSQLLVQPTIWGCNPTAPDGSYRALHINVAYVNNCMQNVLVPDSAALFSSIGDNNYHTILAHNSAPGIRYLFSNYLRNGLHIDSYSRFICNVYDTIGSTDHNNPSTPLAYFDNNNILMQIKYNNLGNLYNVEQLNWQTGTNTTISSSVVSGKTVYSATPGGSMGPYVSNNKYLQTANSTQTTNNLDVRDYIDYPKLTQALSPSFLPSDFTPSSNGFLRQSANLQPSHILYDIEGRLRTVSGDLAGGVAISAPTS